MASIPETLIRSVKFSFLPILSGEALSTAFGCVNPLVEKKVKIRIENINLIIEKQVQN